MTSQAEGPVEFGDALMSHLFGGSGIDIGSCLAVGLRGIRGSPVYRLMRHLQAQRSLALTPKPCTECAGTHSTSSSRPLLPAHLPQMPSSLARARGTLLTGRRLQRWLLRHTAWRWCELLWAFFNYFELG